MDFCYSVYLSIGGHLHRTASEFLVGGCSKFLYQGELFPWGSICLFSVRYFSFVCFRLYTRAKSYSRVRICFIVGDLVFSGFMLPVGEFPPPTVGVPIR